MGRRGERIRGSAQNEKELSARRRLAATAARDERTTALRINSHLSGPSCRNNTPEQPSWL